MAKAHWCNVLVRRSCLYRLVTVCARHITCEDPLLLDLNAKEILNFQSIHSYGFWATACIIVSILSPRLFRWLAHSRLTDLRNLFLWTQQTELERNGQWFQVYFAKHLIASSVQPASGAQTRIQTHRIVENCSFSVNIDDRQCDGGY